MKIGDLLTDSCTDSVGHIPVSSRMPCASSGTRNLCPQTWILQWFRAGWDAAVMPTCSALHCQCNCHLLPWAVASTERKQCAGGKKPLGRKCRTAPAGIVLGLSGRVMSLSAVSMAAFKHVTDVAQPPSRRSLLSLDKMQGSYDSTWGFFKKRIARTST